MGTGNQVTLETAIKWIKAWQDGPPSNADGTIFKGTDFKACKIPIADLQDIMNVNIQEGIRAYNGYDADNKIFKVLVVALDPDGHDMINTDTPETPNIYDLTLPCPDTCDIQSPLFNP